jgi:hypothetical protein
MIRMIDINIALVEPKGQNKEAIKLYYELENFITSYPYPLSYSLDSFLIEPEENENENRNSQKNGTSVRLNQNSDQENKMVDD